MKSLRHLSPRAAVVVDQLGLMLADPTTNSVLGLQTIPVDTRLAYALETNLQSGLTRRYRPSHVLGETSTFGMDFSGVVPLGIAISTAVLSIQTNRVPPAAAPEWTIGTVTIIGHAVYAICSGGTDGSDYRFVWTITDGTGMTAERTVLCLCSSSS